MLEHGGRLRRAARRYGIPLADWLDLSTGINPCGWPVPPLPADCWARLPEADDGLETAASAYYGCPAALPLAGSQAAIQTLPRLRPPGRVGVLHPAYAEHAAAWAAAGHAVQPLAAEAIEDRLDRLDVLVLVNPNNPTGVRFAPARLLDWQRRLARRGGWLVVDEAYMDPSPEASLCPQADRPGLLVLRSLGKFFGLAGARVGFACGDPRLLDALREALGPWPLTGPSRQVAILALADRAWQAATRRRLPRESARLRRLLSDHGLAPDGGSALFQWLRCDRAPAIEDALARRAILVRRFDDPPSLRFGLPGDAAAWRRLEEALRTIAGAAA